MSRIFTLFFVLPVVMCQAQTKSTKRGLAYGKITPADMEILSPGISWWYNWYYQPEAGVLSQYEDYDVDFVPMAWDENFDEEGMRNFLKNHPNVHYILGWNEPNFITQANLPPSEAAARWPLIQAIADEFDLKIVGPAVNYCDQCVTENGHAITDPVEYLDAFFEACAGCRVDYIALHNYMGNVSALEWYVDQFKKYNKPIWLQGNRF